jgi:hypothetical protein
MLRSMQTIRDWLDRQGRWQDCPAHLALPAHLLADLEALDGAHEIRPAAYCELELGHDGPHYSQGQGDVVIDGDPALDRWVTWTDPHDVHVRAIPMCRLDAVDLDGEETGCQLPAGHPGPHACLGPAVPGQYECVVQRWVEPDAATAAPPA